MLHAALYPRKCMKPFTCLELSGGHGRVSPVVVACSGQQAETRHVFVGKLVDNQGSSGMTQHQQQQHQQRMILGDHTATSLLDVESDMPLTFALDTQMLQLPLTPPLVPEGGWGKRFMDKAFGF